MGNGEEAGKPAPCRTVQALRRVHHFACLSDEVQEAVARAAAPRQFEPGQTIYHEGDPAAALYILETGWVKATRVSGAGREQAMAFLKAGEIFGDVAVFSDTFYPCTVIALEPVTAWAIQKTAILELAARYPELARAVARRLGERVLYYIGLVEDLSLRGVEARLANTLLKHVELSEGRLVVPRRAWTTFDEMATRLGTVRDVLSRSLRTLEEEGLLRVERREIVILDPDGLTKRGTS